MREGCAYDFCIWRAQSMAGLASALAFSPRFFVERQLGRLRMVTTGYVWLLFVNVPTGRAASDPGPGQRQRQRRRCQPEPPGNARGSHSDHGLSIQQGMRHFLLNETYGHLRTNSQRKRDRYNPTQGGCHFFGRRMKSENGYL